MTKVDERMNYHSRTVQIVLGCLFAIISLVFFIESVASLEWRSMDDPAVIRYSAFLVNHYGLVPYRDFFYTNLPGAILFHAAYMKLLGNSDLAYRTVDIGCLVFLMAVTWRLMRRFGKFIGLLGPFLFGLLYLSFGTPMGLQRDYLGVIPIAVSVLVVVSDWIAKKIQLKALLIGLLFGLAVSVKPHLVIGLPILLIYLMVRDPSSQNIPFFKKIRMLLQLHVISVLGLMAIALSPYIWLWHLGGLSTFWEMFSRYLPLHIQLSGYSEMTPGVHRVFYLFEQYQLLGGFQYLIMPAALAGYLIFSEGSRHSHTFREAALLFSLLCIYSIYPVISGQFWTYHWMPFAYFGTLCASIVIVPPPLTVMKTRARTLVPILVFVYYLLLGLRPATDFVRQIKGLPVTTPNDGNVDQVASFLESKLKPGDTVQPLDWCGGANHALLIAEARLSTPFLYDYHFYHHISNETIIRLRSQFINSLSVANPRFIVDMLEKRRVKGWNTTNRFDALTQFIREHYTVVLKERGFIIYERK